MAQAVPDGLPFTVYGSRKNNTSHDLFMCLVLTGAIWLLDHRAAQAPRPDKREPGGRVSESFFR